MICSLIHIDHMRNESKYKRNLDDLCTSSDTTCIIIKYASRLIFLIICGKTEESIKKFLNSFKSSNIDVSSRGQKCKERMSSVVGMEIVPADVLFSFDTVIHEVAFSDLNEARAWFIKSRADCFFSKLLSPCLKAYTMTSYIYSFFVILIAAILVRWLVSVHPHSGQGKPPMFGDFEAQRHWLEITVNLPLAEWYRNTSDNDLLYWGLDYPVLTAYHSFALGKIAQLFNHSWTDLYKSRGLEYYEFKLFMRATVVVADLIIFFPAVLFLLQICRKVYSGAKLTPVLMVLAVILLCPPLILIDHGHFQYNCVSLGLALGAFAFFNSVPDDDEDEEEVEFFLPNANYLLGSVLFVLALCYKQMELYHALPVFFFLLGKCLHQKRFLSGVTLLGSLGLTVILTFITIMLPFLIPSHQPTLDVLARMFPVDRGLYEDKVASFWCALSTVWKFQTVLTVQQQLLACSSACFLSFAPTAFILLREPRRATLLPAIAISSLCFFLFSYHVHEKSILLASVPAIFLLEVLPVEITWFSVIAATSMLPLLIKDGLVTTFFGVQFIWASAVIFYFASRTNNKSNGESFLPSIYLKLRPVAIGISVLTHLVVCFCLIAGVPKPPDRWPFLYPLLLAVLSCAHLFLFLVIFYCMLFGFAKSAKKLKKK